MHAAVPNAIGRARPAYLDLAGPAGAYPALDGLRAVAIALVLARHGVTALPGAAEGALPAPLQWLYHLALNGWLGVDLFFVLSGCLIATHLLRWQHFAGAPYRFGAYLQKRACRTFPLYYAIIALILLGLIPHFAPAKPVDGRELLVLASFTQDYFGTGLMVTLWSLAVEEKFYLLAPFLVFGIARNSSTRRAVSWLLLLSLFMFALRTTLVSVLPPSDYSDFFWRLRAPYSLEPFLFGVICAFLASSDGAKQFARQHAGALSSLSLAVLLYLFCSRPWVESQSWLGSSLAICLASASFACLVFTSIASAGVSESFLGRAPLRVLSRLSYALYLTHYTVIPAAALGSAQLAGAAGSAGYALVFLTLYLAYAFGFAVLLHLVVEKPFLILKDRIR